MGTVIQVDWADILQTEGINAQGYGLIPKYAMIDPDLTLTAKTIYAYFCSLSGNGNSAFPAVSTIRSTLKLAESTYLSAMKLLTKTGYVIVQKRRGDHAYFTHNLYILASNPKKFDLANSAPSSGNSQIARICSEGIKALGYGMIPRAVMCDPRLSLKAKGIYAYFSSFTGAGNIAFPELGQITRQLKINKDTYYKYFKELVSLNYIAVVQLHTGKYAGNQYYLIDKPDQMASQKTKRFKAVPTEDHQLPKKQCPVKQRPEKQSPANERPEKECPENPGTTNITVASNTLSINKSIHQQAQTQKLSPRALRVVRWIDEMSREELTEHFFSWFTLELDEEGRPLESYPEEDQRIIPIVRTIIDLVEKKTPFYKIGDLQISRAEYISKILELTVVDLIDITNRLAALTTPVRNPTAYLIVALYNAAKDKNLPGSVPIII